MSGNNSTPKSDWIRLNVGGKVFQTTKDTLSRYPDSFLARLVNGDLPSAKDESGAYLIDADPENFRTILNYLRRGSVELDSSKVVLGDLLREADFFSIQPLVDQILEQIQKESSAQERKRIAKIRTMDELKSISSKLSNMESNRRTGSFGRGC